MVFSQVYGMELEPILSFYYDSCSLFIDIYYFFVLVIHLFFYLFLPLLASELYAIIAQLLCCKEIYFLESIAVIVYFAQSTVRLSFFYLNFIVLNFQYTFYTDKSLYLFEGLQDSFPK